MKEFLLKRIIGFAAKKLDGYKSKIGGVGFVLLGLAGIMATMFPDVGLPAMSLEVSLGMIATGMSTIGIAGKLQKQTAAVVAATAQGNDARQALPESPEGPKND